MPGGENPSENTGATHANTTNFADAWGPESYQHEDPVVQAAREQRDGQQDGSTTHPGYPSVPLWGGTRDPRRASEQVRQMRERSGMTPVWTSGQGDMSGQGYYQSAPDHTSGQDHYGGEFRNPYSNVAHDSSYVQGGRGSGREERTEESTLTRSARRTVSPRR